MRAGAARASCRWRRSFTFSVCADGATPFGRLSDPFPVTGPQLPPGNSQGQLTRIGLDIPGPRCAWGITPYVQTWSFGIQRELPGGVLIDASHVGTKGTHLYYGGAGGLNDLGSWVETATRACSSSPPTRTRSHDTLFVSWALRSSAIRFRQDEHNRFALRPV